jgi:hypothetical protein
MGKSMILVLFIDTVLAFAFGIEEELSRLSRSRLARRNLDELTIWQKIIHAKEVENQIDNLQRMQEELEVINISRIRLKGTV